METTGRLLLGDSPRQATIAQVSSFPTWPSSRISNERYLSRPLSLSSCRRIAIFCCYLSFNLWVVDSDDELLKN